jgi:hypothetical protein
MTTGLAFAVLTMAAVGTAVAAVFVLRAVPAAAPAPGPVASAQAASSLDSPDTLANQTLSNQGRAARDTKSSRSARATPEETRPTLVPLRPPAKVPSLASMPEYDPDQESEDDVPTTLFHSEDSAEIEAFVAELEEKRGR